MALIQWTGIIPFESGWLPAVVDRIVDADTFDLTIDVGFDIHINARIRLLTDKVVITPGDSSDDGVDAWEVRGSERELGLKATDRVRELMPEGSSVMVFSKKGGSKGSLSRWLCAVLYKSGDYWLSIGDQLIEEGHAEVWNA